MFKLDRIRKAAKRDKSLKFNNLMHHITVELLKAAYQKLKKEAAAGIDGVIWSQYGENLESKLENLFSRVQSGRYRAKPSKRIWIPKTDGSQRPIGIAALEDKIVQAAVVKVLNQIYEEEFVGFSYGFRPKRSQHNALDAVWVGITRKKIGWILDTDIRSFFDNMDHIWLKKFLEHRIADKRMLRLISKWLKAGVFEEDLRLKRRLGVPQGAVISPLLSNIYLHYVLDLWVNKWRKTKTEGDVIIVRYADDSLFGFQYRNDAIDFMHKLHERMARFSLEIHQDKTRLIEFGRFAAGNRLKFGKEKPETFDFLGFTHICSETSKKKFFTIKRKTVAKRLRAKIKEIGIEIMRIRHKPVPEQGKWLRSVVQGYFNYHAVPGNFKAIDSFRTQVIRAWFKALRRRSHKARKLIWKRFQRLVKKWIPSKRLMHPHPYQRLCVKT